MIIKREKETYVYPEPGAPVKRADRWMRVVEIEEIEVSESPVAIIRTEGTIPRLNMDGKYSQTTSIHRAKNGGLIAFHEGGFSEISGSIEDNYPIRSNVAGSVAYHTIEYL